jgi:hypothetical protein
MKIKKEHGTVLAGICFRSYKVPIIEIPSTFDKTAGRSQQKKRTRKKRRK